MFTGIVKGQAEVVGIVEDYGIMSLELNLPSTLLEGLEVGASVAVDGVCLTVTKMDHPRLVFDVMLETLSRTTLGSLKEGDQVNIERSARGDVEIGGHVLSGHIDATARIVNIGRPSNNCVLTFRVPPEWMKYLFAKGYVALNGASLTIAAVDKEACQFDVWFIPETLRVTTFSSKIVGDLVNLEIERNTQVMVDTIREFLEERFGSLPTNSHPSLSAADSDFTKRLLS